MSRPIPICWPRTTEDWRSEGAAARWVQWDLSYWETKGLSTVPRYRQLSEASGEAGDSSAPAAGLQAPATQPSGKLLGGRSATHV